MTDVAFRTLGFSVRYRCWARSDLPSEEPVFYFPDRVGNPVSQVTRVVVSFAGHDRASWTGSFLREFDGCADMLLASPDPLTACVVAGGLAWVIDVDHPDRARTLDVVPVTDALGCPPAGRLFLASHHVVAAFDAAMTSVWSVRLKADGVEFVAAEDSHVVVKAYSPSSGAWQTYRLGISDGSFE